MRCGRMKHEGASMGGSGGKGGGGREEARRPDAFSSRGVRAKSGRGLTVHEERKEMKLQPNTQVDKTTSNLYARSASEVFVCLALWKLRN